MPLEKLKEWFTFGYIVISHTMVERMVKLCDHSYLR